MFAAATLAPTIVGDAADAGGATDAKGCYDLDAARLATMVAGDEGVVSAAPLCCWR